MGTLLGCSRGFTPALPSVPPGAKGLAHDGAGSGGLISTCYTSPMFPRRDPNLLSQYLCRFCGEQVPWGVILRVLRVDPDTPGFMLNESYCHTDCLRGVVQPGVMLTF